MPYFSIIIPVYNVAPYLRECLDSVLVQTFTDWEMICVDDGSTDESGAILDKYVIKDVRIKVVRQENQGVVAARVNGFYHANGKMILFVDGDDELKNNALEILYAKLEECDVDILEYGYEMRMLTGCVNFKRPQVHGLFYAKELIKRIKKTPLELIGMCIGDKCYKRRVVQNAFGMVSHIRISHSEDGLFAFAAFVNSEKMYFLEDCMYVYKLRKGSAVTRINRKIVKEKVSFINKIGELARKSGLLTEMQISRMINFHQYQACCYVFLMLARNGGSWRDYKMLLTELQDTNFMEKENYEWRGLKRRGLKFLIFHPFLSWLLYSIGIFKK